MQGRTLVFALAALLLFAAGDALALDKLLLMCFGSSIKLPPHDPEEQKLRARRDDDEARHLDAHRNLDNVVKAIVRLNCDKMPKTAMTAACKKWWEYARFWAHDAIFWRVRAEDSQVALSNYLVQRDKQEAAKQKAACTQALGPAPAQKPQPRLVWQRVGEGDCTGNDVGSSDGSSPKNEQAREGYTAVCWDGNNKNNPGKVFCTYKSVPPEQCTGGRNPGARYRAVRQ